MVDAYTAQIDFIRSVSVDFDKIVKKCVYRMNGKGFRCDSDGIGMKNPSNEMKNLSINQSIHDVIMMMSCPHFLPFSITLTKN
jgi:hypothetical protein